MSDELMPCPFCGGEARILEDTTGDYLWPDRFVVECSNEHCMASSMWSTRERVVFAWNRRAPVVHLAPDFGITINAPSGGGGVAPIGCGLTPLPESSDGVP